ncbi:MAG: hypothetical protein ACI4TV_04630 [Paludibacteraceae bacterium]
MQSNASIMPSAFTSTSAYRNGSEAVSAPRTYDVMGRDITPIGYYGYNEGTSMAGRQHDFFLTADMYLEQCSQAGVAQTPYQYATVGAEQPISRMNRPGGGTGVIPNPVGDSVGILIVLAICYAFIRYRRWKHARS